jgi:pyruvate kinase
VCTVGPATDDRLTALVEAGMDVARRGEPATD